MADDKKLNQIRARIDKIDAGIIELLSKRLVETAEIGALKRDLNKPIVDEKREQILHDHLLRLSREHGVDESFILKVWELILQESYRIQNENK